MKISHPINENKIIKKKIKAPISETAGNVRSAIESAFRRFRIRDNKSQTRNGRENRVGKPRLVAKRSTVMATATTSRLDVHVARKS